MGKRCSRVFLLTLAFLVLAGPASAQVSNSGTLAGLVTDPTGAVIGRAEIQVKDDATGGTVTSKSAPDGTFVVANLRPGSYTVTVSLANFKTAEYRAVKVTVGDTYNLNAKLEVGPVTSSLVVEAGQEVLETQQTSVSATITGKAITQLPFTSRDVLDLATLFPGVQTTGNPRNSSINGLPKGAINITYDGINDQSNLLKSSDGFFTMVRPRTDAIEEFSLTTAGSGAENTEGAAQIRMETKRGGNSFHGGVWWYHRNDFLNSNFYFNNLAGTPRQRLRLNQFGYKVGGPILKDKLFFFHAFDFYRKPESQTQTRTILTGPATQGLFTYNIRAALPATLPAWAACTATTCTVDLFALAAANSHASLIDPVIGPILAAMNSSVTAPGVGLLPSTSLFQRTLTFNDFTSQNRFFPDWRFDWNVTQNHQWTLIYHYNDFAGQKDLLNGRGISFPVAPFDQLFGGQFSSRNQITTAWRWNLSSNKSNEFRVGVFESPSWFAQGLDLSIYPAAATSVGPINIRPCLVNGQACNANTIVSQAFQSFAPAPRTEAHAQFIENFSWTTGKHSFSFGGSVTALRAALHNLSSAAATVTTGLGATDPAAVLFGAAATTGGVQNFPGAAASGTNASASAADMTNAGNLYALLTGRVTSYQGFVPVDEDTRSFVTGGRLIQRIRQTEFGFYATDTWRLTHSLTANLGLRWEFQPAPRDPQNITFNLQGAQDALFGVSGAGNLFAPGALSGAVPTYVLNGEAPWYDTDGNNLAPSVGMAWQPGADHRWLNYFTGGPGKTVLRAGYSVSYTREGTNNWFTMSGNNPGFTGGQTLFAGNPANPGEFAAGSLFTGSLNFPNVLQDPPAFVQSFPLIPSTLNQVNVWSQNLAVPLVHSWTVGFQRELSQSMALEVRYVGNHGAGLWRRSNYNEVNVFENGFLQEFLNARSNLSICQANSAACIAAQAAAGVTTANRTSGNFANWGLPGQVALPIMTAAFTGATTGLQTNANFRNATRVSNLTNGLAGAFANALANSLTFWQNLTGCSAANPAAACGGPFPANFWVVNPHAFGGSFLMNNNTHSTYNALQIEVRRRPSKGLQFNTNYTWSKSLTNLYADSSSNSSNFSTLRSLGRDKGPSPFDLRHQFKLLAIYEMPFGPGRRWISSHAWANRVIEGWEVSAITRWQSGRIFSLTGGSGGTVNQNDGGVELVAITPNQIQSMLSIRTAPSGEVYYFPASLLDASQQRANSAFIRPCSTPGAFCQRLFLWGPSFFRSDINIVKRTRITEKVNAEFRAEFLNAFNNVNFFFGGASALNVIPTTNTQSLTFGRILNAYQDISTTDDPGGRIIQLVLRINF